MLFHSWSAIDGSEPITFARGPETEAHFRGPTKGHRQRDQRDLVERFVCVSSIAAVELSGPTNLITASEGAVEMGDAATSIVDRLITPSGCLAKATGVIRPARAFISPVESENRRHRIKGSTLPIDQSIGRWFYAGSIWVELMCLLGARKCSAAFNRN